MGGTVKDSKNTGIEAGNDINSETNTSDSDRLVNDSPVNGGNTGKSGNSGSGTDIDSDLSTDKKGLGQDIVDTTVNPFSKAKKRGDGVLPKVTFDDSKIAAKIVAEKITSDDKENDIDKDKKTVAKKTKGRTAKIVLKFRGIGKVAASTTDLICETKGVKKLTEVEKQDVEDVHNDLFTMINPIKNPLFVAILNYIFVMGHVIVTRVIEYRENITGKIEQIGKNNGSQT